MARKLRLEFPGACYHVINRGNYRGDVFGSEGAKAAFESCLFEACDKSGWVLHAFVIMRNHFHLAIETPAGNLVAGMHWLEVTFASRFNRLRDERGHVFQGRYKALLVEEGDPLGMVCHYIHLNPVRAGIVPVERLGTYRYSSCFYLDKRTARPGFLSLDTALLTAGYLPDKPSGWKKYIDYLAWQAAEGPTGKSKAYVNLSRGWALGGEEFKHGLLRDHAMTANARAWESVGAREMRALHWNRELERALAIAARIKVDLSATAKSAAWKMTIASWMKCRTQASNAWLCDRLHLGTPAAFSRNLSLHRRLDRSNNILWKTLISSSAT